MAPLCFRGIGRVSGSQALSSETIGDAPWIALPETKAVIAALEARYRAQTGIASLKIRHNGVLGYHVEVPARAADPLMQADSGL